MPLRRRGSRGGRGQRNNRVRLVRQLQSRRELRVRRRLKGRTRRDRHRVRAPGHRGASGRRDRVSDAGQPPPDVPRAVGDRQDARLPLAMLATTFYPAIPAGDMQVVADHRARTEKPLNRRSCSRSIFEERPHIRCGEFLGTVAYRIRRRECVRRRARRVRAPTCRALLARDWSIAELAAPARWKVSSANSCRCVASTPGMTFAAGRCSRISQRDHPRFPTAGHRTTTFRAKAAAVRDAAARRAEPARTSDDPRGAGLADAGGRPARPYGPTRSTGQAVR